ncbi:MAG: ribonuclease R [Pseudomonadota bacterium]|nr:ribonuclease R [Pseudomonadota bacterium]
MSDKFKLKKDPQAAIEAKRYNNPIASRAFILEFLKFKGKAVTFATLAQQFSLKTKEQKHALETRLRAMMRDGQITEDKNNKILIVKKLKPVQATILSTKEKGIYALTKAGEEVFLQARFTKLVLSGDKVLVKILPKNHKHSEVAILDKIVEHQHKTVTGLYKIENGVAKIEPALKSFKFEVFAVETKIKAQPGQYVVAKITHYPELNKPHCTAEVIKLLGDTSVNGVELSVAISAHDIPHKWPAGIYPEVAKLGSEISTSEVDRREDLRSLPFVTIDGEDSRDFDDAVYAYLNDDGTSNLYVAIADVSHYVKTGSELDKEALNRATSVYFPREVVPMLPEALSNDLCSLVPNKDRLAMVAKLSLDSKGKLKSYEFCRALIKSHARLTYTKVFKMLTAELDTPVWFQQPLAALHKLYEQLSKLRKARHAIEFSAPESRIIFNKEGKIAKIVTQQRNKAHLIIEECMLVANNAAALYLEKHKVPTLYRIHAAPEAKKVVVLEAFLAQLGLEIKFGKRIKPQDYNHIMQLAKGKSFEHIVNVMLLRTMQQAVYQPENIGHYGLCYENYLHFTSPIRRYPDLIVHRCLAAILDSATTNTYTSKNLTELGQHCSMAERRAEIASRDVVSWLKCCYMQDKIGQTFQGIISSVTSFGLFVEIKDIHIDGLVHISSLGNDYYDFNPALNQLIGRKDKKRFSIGGNIKVKVARVDINAKFIDFEPITD